MRRFIGVVLSLLVAAPVCAQVAEGTGGTPANSTTPAAVPVQTPRLVVGVAFLTPLAANDGGPVSTRLSVGWGGTYRFGFDLQAGANDLLGLGRASIGRRLFALGRHEVVATLEETYVSADREVFRSAGARLLQRDAKQLSALVLHTGTVIATPWFDIQALEIGAGWTHSQRWVSAKADGAVIGGAEASIYESESLVALAGARLGRRLPLGFTGGFATRIVVPQNISSGVIPKVSATFEWDLGRELKLPWGRRVHAALIGAHTTNPKTVTYQANAVGLRFIARF